MCSLFLLGVALKLYIHHKKWLPIISRAAHHGLASSVQRLVSISTTKAETISRKPLAVNR